MLLAEAGLNLQFQCAGRFLNNGTLAYAINEKATISVAFSFMHYLIQLPQTLVNNFLDPTAL